MGKRFKKKKKKRHQKNCKQSDSVQFSCSVMSDSLRPHEPQHARPPCPSPTPRVHPNPCPLSRWCHPTISSSVIPFSSRLQSFPASGSFPMNQLFTSGGQSIGVSASASVLPMNTQGWSLGWTGWISLQSKGLSRVLSNTPVQKHQFFCSSCLYSPTLTSMHLYFLSHIILHYGLSQVADYNSLCYTAGPCCLSTFHVIVCLRQPQTPSPSLHRLLPSCNHSSALCLWICFCFIDKLVCVIF